jgi:protein involved in polysaccharide export with SLBB domain
VRPGAYPWQEDTRLLQAILRAGAFRPDARAQDTFVVRDHKLIHVDPVAILRENSPPFLLQPFDVVVVGTKEGSVPFIPPSRD